MKNDQNQELSARLKKRLLELFPKVCDTRTSHLLSLLREERENAEHINLYVLVGYQENIDLPRFKKIDELWEEIQREWSLPTTGQLAVGPVNKGEKVAWIDPQLFSEKVFTKKQKENISSNGPGPFVVLGFGNNHKIFIANQRGDRVGVSPFWFGKKI